MYPKQSLSGFPNLLKGPKVVIYHAESDTDTPTKFYESFPVNVAKRFSGLCRDALPRAGYTTVNRKGCDGSKTITLYGCKRPALAIIFNWMLASCQGKGFAKIEFLPFAKLCRVLEAADMLDVPKVVDSITSRMDKIAASQVPIEDVKMVYATYPKTSAIRQLVVRSIGDAIYERRLRKWGAYQEFRQQCEAYAKDIAEYLHWKHDVRAEARRNVWIEAWRRKCAKSMQAPNKNVNTKTASAVDGNVNTRTVSAVVSRKGKGARPTYAKVPLKEFDIPQSRYYSIKTQAQEQPRWRNMARN